MVDAGDLKSPEDKSREGSNPFSPTSLKIMNMA